MSFGAVGGAIGGALITGSIAKSEGKKNRKAAANQTPKFNTTLQPFIEKNLDNVFGQFNDTAKDRKVFSGDRTADLTGRQVRGIGMGDALVGSLGDQARTAAGGFDRFASGEFIGNNPYVDAQVAATQESINRNLQRNMLPGIASNAAGTGNVGTSRQGVAEGIAMGDALRAGATAETNLRANAYNTDVQNMLTSLINQGSILGGQTRGADTLLRLGGLEQEQDQREINSRIDAFNEGQDLDFARDRDLLALLLGTPTSTPVIPPTSNPATAAIGGAMMGHQLFGGMQQQPAPAPYIPPSFYNQPVNPALASPF